MMKPRRACRRRELRKTAEVSIALRVRSTGGGGGAWRGARRDRRMGVSSMERQFRPASLILGIMTRRKGEGIRGK
jgi:hypothetical protein